MENLIKFLRAFLFCIIMITTSIALEPIFSYEPWLLNKIFAWGGGTLLALFLLHCERWVCHSPSMHTLIFPLFGVFLGHHLSLLFFLWSPVTLVEWPPLSPVPKEVLAIVHITITASIFYMSILFSSHIGKAITENTRFFHMFRPNESRKNKWLLDLSALLDPRTTSLAASGLLNNSLAVDDCLSKQLSTQLESGNECVKTKAKQALYNLEKLQAIPDLSLESLTWKTTMPSKGTFIDSLQLAKEFGLGVLTAESPKVSGEFEQVKILSLQQLAHILKPLFQLEGPLRIKIRRVGKEPHQGIGYLEDGTMVVVNNAGNRVGHLVEAQVLSTKHTSAGRIVFCNCNNEDPILTEEHDEETESVLLAGENV